MTDQNTIVDLSTTPASNLNFKGQSVRGTALANTIDTMFQNEASMLKAFYDSLGGVATVSGTDTYTVTITEDWAAYASGLILAIKPANANTGAATLNVTVPTAGALGAKAIRRQGDSALSANDMLANGVYLLRYSSTYNSSAGAWILLNPAASGGVVSDSVFRVQDNGDATKQLAFEVSGVTTGTTRTVTVPNENGTLGLNGGTSTDNNIPRYDGTLGKIQAGTGLAIDDTFNITMSSPSGSEGTKYPAFFARAWVNFNGTGTVAIRASGNVSSITDNGTGDYTVNFATAMPDANYAAVGLVGAGSVSGSLISGAQATPTASAYRLSTASFSGTNTDYAFISVGFFR